jgi:hypothetical protein
MVKLGGAPSDPAVTSHIEFARSLGFNAVWVDSDQAGSWSAAGGRRPSLTREFRRLASRTRARELSLWVSINPVAGSQGLFVFSEPEGEERIVRFATLLRERAGVRQIVLSFDDQPTRLTNLGDIDRYGASAAPAHLDLARRIASRLPPGMRLWLCAATYCDAHLGAGEGPYSKPFLEGIASLPHTIGIVWTGPEVVSPSITRSQIDAVRSRLGGRPLLLYDNFPMNDGAPPKAIALSLAPLSGRDPGIARSVAAYLACPLPQLGASRITLATIADFLHDPAGYDPRASRDRALSRLLGPGASEETRVALDTQQIEWGAFPRDPTTPAAAVGRLHDPAFVDSFTWTAARYPGRIASLAGLSDAPLREDLLRAMRRRLALAQALPLAIEYLARRAAGRADAAEVLARLQDQRASWSSHPEALDALESFLSASGIPVAPARPS